MLKDKKKKNCFYLRILRDWRLYFVLNLLKVIESFWHVEYVIFITYGIVELMKCIKDLYIYYQIFAAFF